MVAVSDTNEQTRQCMLDMFKACDRLDVDDVASHFSEDAYFTIGGLPALDSRSKIAESMRFMFSNYLKVNHSIHEVIFAPDHVVALGTIYYTVKNGVDITVKACMVIQSRQRQVEIP
ncbi:hypothetical protein GYMLUDRAFT_85180 [Collybiopsis luxurians FD-317 M1]|uniref:SnoaL-like domain-containing protein n=1 Tax=Collybiopsis luxurians FD-317 M1 TaxID=944289 RepID=A0A0D0CQE5_9AGAR|nr:hypothetical protein GYMLUDRAFT_85180 [Collybiopsis luxurians FD-317 M1]